MVGALVVLHNFIQIYDLANEIEVDEDLGEDMNMHTAGTTLAGKEQIIAKKRSLLICGLTMWADYVCRQCHN